MDNMFHLERPQQDRRQGHPGWCSGSADRVAGHRAQRARRQSCGKVFRTCPAVRRKRCAKTSNRADRCGAPEVEGEQKEMLKIVRRLADESQIVPSGGSDEGFLDPQALRRRIRQRDASPQRRVLPARRTWPPGPASEASPASTSTAGSSRAKQLQDFSAWQPSTSARADPRQRRRARLGWRCRRSPPSPSRRSARRHRLGRRSESPPRVNRATRPQRGRRTGKPGGLQGKVRFTRSRPRSRTAVLDGTGCLRSSRPWPTAWLTSRWPWPSRWSGKTAHQPQLIRQGGRRGAGLLVETARHIRLVVNPEDYALLAEHAAQDLSPAGPAGV